MGVVGLVPRSPNDWNTVPTSDNKRGQGLSLEVCFRLPRAARKVSWLAFSWSGGISMSCSSISRHTYRARRCMQMQCTRGTMGFVCRACRVRVAAACVP